MLIGASVYPLPGHQRVRSGIEAMADGGRKEDFYINVSADRILHDEAGVAAYPVPAMNGGAGQYIQAEVFQLRNADRQVIGLASRMRGIVPDSAGSPTQAVSWVLFIPSRGSLVLDQVRVMTNGLIPEMEAVQQGRVVTGDGEFARLKGQYIEALVVEENYDSGQQERFILLSTRLRSGAS